MKTASTLMLHWLPAPALALLGVVTVRWIAPCFVGRTQAILIVVGYLVVPLGLFWFASRLGQRAAQRATVSKAVELPH